MAHLHASIKLTALLLPQLNCQVPRVSAKGRALPGPDGRPRRSHPPLPPRQARLLSITAERQGVWYSRSSATPTLKSTRSEGDLPAACLDGVHFDFTAHAVPASPASTASQSFPTPAHLAHPPKQIASLRARRLPFHDGGRDDATAKWDVKNSPES